MNEDRVLDGVQAIADWLGLERRAVQHMIDAHGMPVVRVGRRIYGRPRILRAWLDQREAGADHVG